MSHHVDSPTAIEDGRIDLYDVFVFPSGPGTTALLLTVNPDAGLSSSSTLRPDAVYEFAVATDGGTQPDLAFRIRFDPRGPCDRSRASPGPPGSGRRPAAPPRQRIGDRRRRARGERRRSVPARRAGLPGRRAGVLVAGRGNGRALGDDVFAAAIAAVTGQRLGARTPPAKASGESPHVTAPQRAALPALADLFGLRVARPTSR